MARVLIVDDAAFMRMTIKQIIETEDHTMVAEAGNGVEAIEKFMETKPDIVILDISMPEMNGIETLKRLKVLDPAAKIIICSAIGYQDLLAQAIECGAAEFILKPFEKEQLVKAIEKVMD